MRTRNTKSRGNGQGSVYKPKGCTTWTAQVTIGWKMSSAGDRLVPIKRTKGGFKLKADASRYIDKLFSATAAKTRYTLQQLYDEWEKFYAPRVGSSTMDSYKYAFKHFAALSGIYVDLITAADLQKCMDDCTAGKRTHENMKCVAGLLWHYAYDKELIDRDITQNLYTGKGIKTKRVPITEKELKIIKDAIGKEQYADYVYAQCFLGFRPTEFLTLKKSDLSIEDHQLIFTQGSKTDAGRNRKVPVPPVIGDIIAARMRQDCDYLFPRMITTRKEKQFVGWSPMTHEYYNKHIFKPLMQKLGIAVGKTPYCARHTYSDKLKKAAGDDQTKASLMGHTDYAFTQSAYQSTSTDDLKTVAKSLK